MADTPVDTATLYDEKPHDSRPGTAHIDVVRAEDDFNALSRSLTQQSESHKKRESTTTVASRDIEKADKDQTEPFSLQDYLTSSNDANQKAGIKHKVGFQACLITCRSSNLATACWSRVGGFAS
jgi:ATP-binding cassette subfamily G (WHITE) protein 2 (SNQ2)